MDRCAPLSNKSRSQTVIKGSEIQAMNSSEKYRIRKYIEYFIIQFKNIVSEEHNCNIFMKIHKVPMIK